MIKDTACQEAQTLSVPVGQSHRDTHTQAPVGRCFSLSVCLTNTHIDTHSSRIVPVGDSQS